MNFAVVAFPQGEGANLMLGYGERSSPCRQRYNGLLRIISRELTWRILPKVISRPASGFGFKGLMGCSTALDGGQNWGDGFTVTPVHCAPRGIMSQLLKTAVIPANIDFEGF